MYGAWIAMQQQKAAEPVVKVEGTACIVQYKLTVTWDDQKKGGAINFTSSFMAPAADIEKVFLAKAEEAFNQYKGRPGLEVMVNYVDGTRGTAVVVSASKNSRKETQEISHPYWYTPPS